MDNIKKSIAKCIAFAINKPTEDIYASIENPKNSSMGDFAYPCFKLSKELQDSPNNIAQHIKNSIQHSLPPTITSVQNVNGYLNFYLDNMQIMDLVLNEILEKKAKYLQSNQGKNKTICIDYSSPNIAKPFHIGHLRSTVIGAALYRLYNVLGYNVIGINYLGDFGTQFGYVIEGYKQFGNEEELLKNPIKHLVEIYVKINEMAKSDDTIVEKARMNFKLLEEKDTTLTALWERFRNLSLDEYKKVYKRLGIVFDSYNGEAYYNDKMQQVINILRSNKLLKDSNGAQVVELEGFNIPCMIIKSNGSTTYATRDLAAIIDRANTYDYYKSIYLTSYEQILHFKQIFKVAENLVDKKYVEGLKHIPFGMVLGPGGKKLSTRKGSTTTLEDVLNESTKKAMHILKEKGNVPSNKLKETADMIGIGAIIFNDLKNNRIKDEIFDLDEMVRFEGETGPYVQYTYVRIKSILTKANYKVGEKFDITLLKEKEEIELIKLLANIKEIIKNAAEEYEPSILTRYIIDIATNFSKYYNEYKIISENEQLTKSRCALIYSISIIIKESLKILGINCPNKM